ncbi:MAG: TetR/AcrR family transcriptional regulator [Nitrospirae bacterium]|nr:TetR/AcrR family transcriptional regulator [Nitrospirota bacterium]
MNHRSAYRVPKSEVLKAALDLFSRKGYSDAKMADIARKVGMSVGALYLRFSNKEELFMELIRDQSKDFIEHTRSLPLHEPLNALKTYIAINIDHALHKRQILSIIYREYNLLSLKDLRHEFFKTQHGIIRDILRAGVKNKAFKAMDINDTASMIFASIRGTIMLKLIFGIGDAKSMGNSLFKLITNGIRKDAS